MSTIFNIFEDKAPQNTFSSNLFEEDRWYDANNQPSAPLTGQDSNPMANIDFGSFLTEEPSKVDEFDPFSAPIEEESYSSDMFGYVPPSSSSPSRKTSQTLSIEFTTPNQAPLPKKAKRKTRKRKLHKKVLKAKFSKKRGSSLSSTDVDSSEPEFMATTPFSRKSLSTFPSTYFKLESQKTRKRSPEYYLKTQEAPVSGDSSDLKAVFTGSQNLNWSLLSESERLRSTLAQLSEQFKLSKVKRSYVRKTPYKKRRSY